MSNVLYPNKQEFDELIKNEKVLVDFSATWCGPCKMIGPNIEKLAEENADATVIKIDVDKHPEIAAVYGVQTIPTLIAFKKGQIVNQKIGFMAETDNDELSMCSMYQVPLRKDEQPQKKYAISMIVDSELMESRGTIHLIRLLQPFIDVLDNGGVIVLDEMDASLHFEIVVSLIRIFNNKDINKNNAQLIFNTHNPIYLDGELLRHDQIVMVEKRRNDMVSEIYSLADYKLRPEERILKNYLNGKYGALPHMDLEIAFKHILEREANNLESSKEQ